MLFPNNFQTLFYCCIFFFPNSIFFFFFRSVISVMSLSFLQDNCRTLVSWDYKRKTQLGIVQVEKELGKRELTVQPVIRLCCSGSSCSKKAWSHFPAMQADSPDSAELVAFPECFTTQYTKYLKYYLNHQGNSLHLNTTWSKIKKWMRKREET